MKKRFKLIIILGPTAVGKTDLAIRLAKYLHCDIISADSRQFYREMEIGTAKPSSEDLDRIKHHLINHISIKDYYSAGRFEKEVINLIDILSCKTRNAILVGGSGLYIDAVCKGIDEIPGPNVKLRANLEELLKLKGLEHLTAELKILDFETWTSIDLKNPKRVIRALEVIYQTGNKFSSIKNAGTKKRNFENLKIGLELDRHILYERINNRADQMLNLGLLEEVKALLPYKNLTALQTVGYQEFFDYLDNKYDLNEAIRLFKRNSRRYAKRQMTWFKRDQEIHWFHPDAYQEITSLIDKFLIL